MSHNKCAYRYTIEVYKKDFAAHLGSVPIQPDFDPVLEWAALEAIRKIPSDTVVLNSAAGRVEPCWHAKLGNPYLGGIRAVVAPGGSPAAAFEIPTSYFQDLAESVSPTLVETGKLEPGEVFQYLVCAYPAEPQGHAENEPEGLLSVKPVTEAVPVDEQSMDVFLADSFPSGSVDDSHIPVFLPRAVIEEAAELTADEQRDTVLRLGGLWPGPLTLVVKAGEVPWRESVAPSSSMLGIRVPDSPLLLSLLGISGPLAVTSANLSGGMAPVSFANIDPAIVARACQTRRSTVSL